MAVAQSLSPRIAMPGFSIWSIRWPTERNSTRLEGQPTLKLSSAEKMDDVELNEAAHLPPRRIWFLWFQGIGNAPILVRRCWETWSDLNPGWELTTLDEKNLRHWVSQKYLDDIDKLRPSHRADAVRLELLAQYGGVWVDATTWCVEPLDKWLPAYMDSGFFAFTSVGRASLLSSWFLASQPMHPVVVHLRAALMSYWANHNFLRGWIGRGLSHMVAKILDRRIETTRYWFSPIIQDGLRLTPYFVFHHKFTQLVERDETVRRLWAATGTLTSAHSHLLQHWGLTDPLSEWSKKEIDSPSAPIYKLTWKLPNNEIPAGSTLEYLLRH